MKYYVDQNAEATADVLWKAVAHESGGTMPCDTSGDTASNPAQAASR